ncbi:MAG: rod shape-determining protein MreD [Bacteroidales bacterium]|nr:rod shape-determining protein MreD [Bacteroidales bacterium]
MLTVVQNILSFIILVLVQVLALNNIQFLGFINPYIYILFILSLPVKLPHWVTLLLAFVLGLTIDAFSNTMGMHAFATVLAAFSRNGIIKLFTSIEEGSNPVPSFYTFGVGAYIKYVVFMVLLHHTTLFLLEAFSFANIWLIIFKIILSSFVTILLILGIRSFNRK